MTRRWCLALDLTDDPDLIAEYYELHQRIWPEIAASIRAAGIVGMEIWRTGNRMVLVMETDGRYDPAARAVADAANPKVIEWEALTRRFHRPLPWAATDQQWVPMERLFSLARQP